MTDAMNQVADWSSHHIEGYATQALERGLDGHFSCPLVTEVLPGFWQGGCIHGVRLPDDFDLVVSLYPWEQFKVGPNTEVIERRAYDSQDVPDFSDLAETAHAAWKAGKKILVHCQAGLNRSGFLAAQILMRDGLTAEEAIQKLRDTRSPMVLCNESFEQALIAMGVKATRAGSEQA